MITDETDTTIALQPETEVEQALLSELFTRLNNIADAPGHPEKIGSKLVYYTLDVDNYDLDLSLWREAECGVDEHGRLSPEPGSRALLVHHGADAEDASSGSPTQEQIDEAVEAISEDVEETGEENKIVAESPFDPTTRTVDEIRATVDESWDDAQLRAMYEEEVNGEARVTAMEYIGGCISEGVGVDSGGEEGEVEG